MKYSIIMALVVCCAITLALGVRAQDAPKEHSMTGCLAKGDAPGTYKLTERRQGAIGWDRVIERKPGPARRPQGRINGIRCAKERCRNGRECTKGPTLYENKCGQDDLADLPVVFIARTFSEPSGLPDFKNAPRVAQLHVGILVLSATVIAAGKFPDDRGYESPSRRRRA